MVIIGTNIRELKAGEGGGEEGGGAKYPVPRLMKGAQNSQKAQKLKGLKFQNFS